MIHPSIHVIDDYFIKANETHFINEKIDYYYSSAELQRELKLPADVKKTYELACKVRENANQLYFESLFKLATMSLWIDPQKIPEELIAAENLLVEGKWKCVKETHPCNYAMKIVQIAEKFFPLNQEKGNACLNIAKECLNHEKMLPEEKAKLNLMIDKL